MVVFFWCVCSVVVLGVVGWWRGKWGSFVRLWFGVVRFVIGGGEVFSFF